MTTKDNRAAANDRQQAALKAAEALRAGSPAAIGAVAADHLTGETCAQCIARRGGAR